MIARARIATVLTLAALGVAGGASGAAAQPRRTVAVLPVVVHAADDSGYLQSGVADMLASRLGQAPGVAVIRVTDPSTATTDAEAAREAARSVGAEFVLYGSFTRFGEGASLDVRCTPAGADASVAPKTVFVQSPTLGELIPRLDGLSEKIARFVSETGAVAASAAPTAAPPVGAAADGQLAELRDEVDALRRRVEALEARLEAR